MASCSLLNSTVETGDPVRTCHPKLGKTAGQDTTQNWRLKHWPYPVLMNAEHHTFVTMANLSFDFSNVTCVSAAKKSSPQKIASVCWNVTDSFADTFWRGKPQLNLIFCFVNMLIKIFSHWRREEAEPGFFVDHPRTVRKRRAEPLIYSTLYPPLTVSKTITKFTVVQHGHVHQLTLLSNFYSILAFYGPWIFLWSL